MVEEMKFRFLRISMNTRLFKTSGSKYSITQIQIAILCIELCYRMKKKVLRRCLIMWHSSVSQIFDLGTQLLCINRSCTCLAAGTVPKHLTIWMLMIWRRMFGSSFKEWKEVSRVVTGIQPVLHNLRCISLEESIRIRKDLMILTSSILTAKLGHEF